MKYQITIENAIRIVRYGTGPISCWPLPLEASTTTVLWHNILLWTAGINLAATIAGYINSMYQNATDLSRVIKTMSELGALLSTLTKMIICKVMAPRLQILIADMETFLKQATSTERKYLQNYVDKCLISHVIAAISAIVGPLAFIAAPLITLEAFPGDFEYPFSVDSYWLWLLLYISQSITIGQVGSTVFVDILFGILMWYTGAKFEMLSMEFQQVTNANDVRRCVQAHQRLIGYADQLRTTTRIMAIEVTAIAMCGVTTGGFVLVRNPPPFELAKYIFFECASAMELFLFTWPADNLIDVVRICKRDSTENCMASKLDLVKSEEVGKAVFDSDWIGKSHEMLSAMLIVIQRCRKPVIITVAGLLPILSLEFYGSAMAAAFSYLTTLRAMTAE